MNESCKLMKELQIAQFAMIEANLYLDTHPYDCEAMKAYEEYSERFAKAVEEYEDKCGALYADSITAIPYDWVKTPFPWETEVK